MLVYAVTIFLSAFLLFQVQPLIAKFILPWFGGSAAVWSAALLFFQLVLLAGYFYAYVVIRYLKPKQQFWVHAGLLAVGLATLPIIPSPVFKATGGGDPTARILLLLAATVGLPYTLLSATSPLLQAWYVRARRGAVPYRLFALSNFGSMLALLSYPTLVEPRMALHRQAVVWSWGFAGFAVVCVLAAWRSKDGVDAVRQTAGDEPSPTLADKFLWIGLAACASILLLAVTSHLTQNVAPIPLLWVVPLSLYLLSFILCFESDRLYPRWLFLPLLPVALGVFTWGITLYERNVAIKRLIPALCGALFVCCMVCHGELSRRRPHPRYLTQFYLMVSVGGAVGGLFVAFVSPRLFRDYLELPVAMVGCAALVTWVLWRRLSGELRPLWMRAGLVLATVGFAGYLGYTAVKKDRLYVRSVRNFYGVMHVRDDDADENGVPAERVLVHGTIDHGTQLKEDTKGRITTSYFGYTSGINRAIRGLRNERGALRLGILGLGAGVTATLANAGDTLHYYEINSLVPDVASHQFGFLKGCPAQVQILMGDARLVLEQIPSENLDFLAMDAFSSDAVPMHLLTREAFQLYLRHLKPDGVLAVHISNRYLDLKPVVAQGMADMGWHGRVIEDDGVDQPYYTGTTWVILSANEK
ncbi:MAG TPA: fused MFS/spermidine synthase, partial [Bryobacteraceae bacterium]|nr:fused MFS/spermidine synthase [Bryobacteraceae bacterium]